MAVKPKKAAAKLTIEDYKKENTKLKRVLTLTADKLHETLNTMQPLVADSKDENFIRVYERGRDHIRRNFNLGTELKKKSKKGKVLSEDQLFFESLPCSPEKTTPLFLLMRITYKEWIVERLKVQPIWEGREFAALKDLEKWFLNIAIIRGKKHQEDTGEQLTQEMVKEAANTSWGNLLNQLLTSDKLTDFMKGLRKLSQIKYYLPNIIDQLQNGTGKQGTAKDQRRRQLEEDQRNIAVATGVEQSDT